jgi:hypothetical protein
MCGSGRGRGLRVATSAAWLPAMLIALPSPGMAAVTAIGGADHFLGPFGQRTDGVVAALVVGGGGGDLTLAAVRYDDTVVGTGSSIVGGLGLPVRSGVMVRAVGARWIGDGSFRAWRAKVGPQWVLPGDRSLTLSYARYEDTMASRSNGVIAEATTPLRARLGGKATASFATNSRGPSALQGSVGLQWSPVRRLELSGEVGLARNAAGAAGQAFPNRGPLDDLPLIGGGGTEPTVERSREIAGTALIGVRVSVP